MPDTSFVNLLAVVAIGFGAPLVLGLAPGLRLPAVVLEIVAGIVVGPAGLGWVEVDEPVALLAVVGLAFLLFLAGLEIDPRVLRGPVLTLAGAGFVLSFAVAAGVGLGLGAAGLVDTPLLVAIILVGTSLGVVVPVLKDAGQSGGMFGQLVIAAATIADFGAILLLSVFFSGESTDVAATVVILVAFALAAVLTGLVVAEARRATAVRGLLLRLQDTTAQIRVRAAFLLLVGLVALASTLGLEVILGAFAAGVILSVVDRDEAMTHPRFHAKLEGAGYGIFIPVFFVTSGLRFDLDALTGSASALAMVPVFVAALLVVRGVPALLYRGVADRRRLGAAALLQATSLPFIVAATQIGLEVGAIDEAGAAALVAAGLVSVLIFPAAALALLREPGRVRTEAWWRRSRARTAPVPAPPPAGRAAAPPPPG